MSLRARSLQAESCQRAAACAVRDAGTPTPAGDAKAAPAAEAVAGDLQKVVTHERLYAPGRLLHIQRPAAVHGGHNGAGAADWSVQSGGVEQQPAGQFRLVDGQPDARFEMIAVRKTWIDDHLLRNIAQALEVAAPVGAVLA